MATNANALKHQARLQEWTAAIQESRRSSQSVRKWCKERGIATATYYRWEREVLHTAGQLRNESQLCATPSFVELQAPEERSRTVSEQIATVRINDATIDIYSGMNVLNFPVKKFHKERRKTPIVSDGSCNPLSNPIESSFSTLP